MRYSGDLEMLILSLTKAEKRHLQVNLLSGDGGKEYSALFLEIEKSRSTKRKSSPKKLGEFDTRRYLFKLIVQRLCDLRSNSSPDGEMLEMMNALEVLRARSMHAARKKMLNKLKRDAYRYERFELLPEILRQERIGVVDPAKSEVLMNEFKEVLERLASIDRYRHLTARMSNLYTLQGEVRTPDQEAEYHSLVSDELLREESKVISAEEKYYFFSLHVLAKVVLNDNRQALQYNARLIEMIESRSWLLRHPNWQKRYADALDNQFLVYTLLPDMKRAEQVLEKLRRQPGYTASFTLRFVNLLGAYVRLGDFERGLDHMEEVESFIAKNGRSLPDLIRPVLFTNISYIWFGNGNYQKSLAWVNSTLDDPTIASREDVVAALRLYHLIIHYELHHDDLLEYLVRSAYRFLMKKQRVFRFEAAFLKFVRKRLQRTSSPAEMKSAFVELKSELNEIFKDPYEKRALEYFDFISWLESKVTGERFSQVVKRNAT